MNQQSRPRRSWRFLLLTLLWTWTVWWAGAASGWSPSHYPGAALFALGGLGPLAVALVLLVVVDSAGDRRDYWLRLVQPRRLGVRGAILALGAPPLAAAVATGTGQWFGWEVNPGSGTIALSGTPVALAQTLSLILVLGPLPEELGWRGYALGPLQMRCSAPAAALILAIVWALWHLPLFAWRGTYQHGLGLLTVSGALFMAGLLADSILLTGLYNRTAGSTLGAIGYHFATNATGELWPLPPTTQAVRLGCIALLAALLITGRGRRAAAPAAGESSPR